VTSVSEDDEGDSREPENEAVEELNSTYCAQDEELVSGGGLGEFRGLAMVDESRPPDSGRFDLLLTASASHKIITVLKLFSLTTKRI